MIEELDKLREIFKLKQIYRFSSVGTRNESSAEHTWSTMVLADYFLQNLNSKYQLDEKKVFDLLLYHDLVEIECGDTPLSPETSRDHKIDMEKYASISLAKKLPSVLSNRFLNLFKEFESQTTQEAKFAKIIDALDGEIHELDYIADWKGWSEDFLRKSKEDLFKDFPELHKYFNDLLVYLNKNNYFNQ